jgi:hypothetical protein
MLDTRTQARLTQNFHDATVGYANASAAAMNAMAQQALDFWMAPMRPQPQTQRHRDHLSWFNPHGSEHYWGRPQPAVTNPWLAFAPWAVGPPAARYQPPVAAPQMMAMTWAFAPFAMWWNSMRGPTFAWPMAYCMMAQGVPDSVAWPTAEANAAVLDAATTISDQTQQAFATYQSAGGFATAHVWAPKQVLAAFALLGPMAVAWAGSGAQQGLF